MSEHKPPRKPDGKWQKGVSGNPSGVSGDLRARINEVSVLAQKLGPKIIKILFDIADNPEEPAMARVVAGNSIMDRAYGKPQQAVDLTNSDGTLASAWAAAKDAIEGDGAEAGVTH